MLVVAATLASAAIFTAHAQTVITGTTTNGAVAPAEFGISGALGNLWTAIDNSDILQATNWAVGPYLTYAPAAADKVGGGVLAVYNVPQLSGNLGSVGAALGADWLGGWSLVSGNVTIQTDTRPLAHISWLSTLPAGLTNIVMTPFAVAGIGAPMSGGNQGAATLWDVGDQIKFGHWMGGRFGCGFTWGEWMHAGKESGHRYHIFVSYQRGF